MACEFTGKLKVLPFDLATSPRKICAMPTLLLMPYHHAHHLHLWQKWSDLCCSHPSAMCDSLQECSASTRCQGYGTIFLWIHFLNIKIFDYVGRKCWIWFVVDSTPYLWFWIWLQSQCVVYGTKMYMHSGNTAFGVPWSPCLLRKCNLKRICEQKSDKKNYADLDGIVASIHRLHFSC